MDVIARTLAEEYPEANAGRGLDVAGLHETIVDDAQGQTWFLFAAALCVLLIACANVAGLLLAYQIGRRHDLATRVTLGATRARLVREAITHSLALSAIGGLAGAALAFGLVPPLVSMAPAVIPRLDEITVDGRVLLFSAALATVTGVACGLVSCLTMSRRAAGRRLRSTGVDIGGRGRRARHVLAVAQVALALMLVIAAGLMVRTVRAVGALDLGFDPARVISIGLTPNWAEWRARGLHPDDFAPSVIDRVRALPAVEAAGFGPMLLGGRGGTGIVVTLPNGDTRAYSTDTVGPGYLEAIGAALVEGRFFTPHDRADRRDVAIVNHAAVRAGWVDGDAPGGHVPFGNRSLEVVGLLSDVRRYDLEGAPRPLIYLLETNDLAAVFGTDNILIRTAGDPLALPAVRAMH